MLIIHPRTKTDKKRNERNCCVGQRFSSAIFKERRAKKFGQRFRFRSPKLRRNSGNREESQDGPSWSEGNPTFFQSPLDSNERIKGSPLKISPVLLVNRGVFGGNEVAVLVLSLRSTSVLKNKQSNEQEIAKSFLTRTELEESSSNPGLCPIRESKGP